MGVAGEKPWEEASYVDAVMLYLLGHTNFAYKSITLSNVHKYVAAFKLK